MASKTRNISLPPELDRSIRERVRSGLYGNASDVIRAGLRALAREEMAASYQQFTQIMAALPRDPITPAIEQAVVRAVRKSRDAKGQKAEK
jgi:putative addiction module CopG family antidote